MNQRNQYPAIFVHGMFGWGSDEGIDRYLPYWGATGGNLMTFLNSLGYETYAASVGPVSSAWDRACELYACLTGKRVDYGKAHASQYHHHRFGRTYEKPLIPDFSATHKVHLIGHSFGSMTVRLFAHLMAFGSPEEQAATDDGELSDLFRGGHADWVQSVVTICAPHNGALIFRLSVKYHLKPVAERVVAAYITAVCRTPLQNRLVDFHLEQFGIHNTPGKQDHESLPKSMRQLLYTKDNIVYGISPEGCRDVNEITQPMIDSVYYFSYAFNAVSAGVKNKLHVQNSDFAFLRLLSNIGIHAYKNDFLSGNYTFDDIANDGLLEVSSAKHPRNQPHQLYDPNKIQPGIWQVMPVQNGDHGTAIGLFADPVRTHVFYSLMMQMLVKTEPEIATEAEPGFATKDSC